MSIEGNGTINGIFAREDPPLLTRTYPVETSNGKDMPLNTLPIINQTGRPFNPADPISYVSSRRVALLRRSLTTRR